MKRTTVFVERRWIASSNREWGAYRKGFAWVRGGSLAKACEKAGEMFKEGDTGLIRILPDETTAQIEKAYDAAGWNK